VEPETGFSSGKSRVRSTAITMIQLALTDRSYRVALCSQLRVDYTQSVRCVDRPDLNTDEVLVLDRDHLDDIPLPILNPERIVLIAGNRNEDLEIAWEAGLQTVVLRKDPINTAMLAVLSAILCVSSNTIELLPKN
jgi:hypothetical protein